MDDLLFTWDENKNAANIKKHGIRFEVAAKVFLDEKRIECFDSEHSIDELRYITIGKVDDIIYVSYTERAERIRLISARFALKEEIDEYYKDYDYR